MSGNLWTPPVYQNARPTFLPDSTPLQERLYRYAPPQPKWVNTFINSDESVTTDLPVAISIGDGVSSTYVHYPWDPGGPVAKPGQVGYTWTGGEILPLGPPPPYATVVNPYWVLQDEPVTQYYTLEVYIVTWLRGGTVGYTVSNDLATVLENAGFGAYLS